MARMKNALRVYEVAELDNTGDEQSEDKQTTAVLAKWITNIEDGSEDATEDYADYAGDGTLRTEVVGISETYNVEGTYDPKDKAQKLIADKKRKYERNIWFRITDNNEGKVVEGPATVSNIIAGTGEASEFQTFSCTISFNQVPEEVPVSNSEEVE